MNLINCHWYFYSADLRRPTSRSMDDGIWADTKKGLVQHSGGKPICKYIRPETKLSKTHINGKSVLSDVKSWSGWERESVSFLRDQKFVSVKWIHDIHCINLVNWKFRSYFNKRKVDLRWHSSLEQEISVTLIELEFWFHH